MRREHASFPRCAECIPLPCQAMSVVHVADPEQPELRFALPQRPTWSGSVSSAAPACPWSAICPEETATACGGTCPLAICPVTCRAATCPWETGPGETCPSERGPVAMHPAATSHVTSPEGICIGKGQEGVCSSSAQPSCLFCCGAGREACTLMVGTHTLPLSKPPREPDWRYLPSRR